MKIIKSDLKNGLISVKIEVEEDLWYLKSIIGPGDKIKARTLRSQFIDRGDQKIKTGRKPMILTILLERVEFNENVYRLRLTGKIIQGPEDVQIGSYHTVEVDIKGIITIIKDRWKNYQIEKIKKSEKIYPKIFLAVVDNDEATLAIVDTTGVKIVSELKNQHSIQYEEEKVQDFYNLLVKEIEKLSYNSKKIILAGPGFAKEHIKSIIEKSYSKMNEILVLDSSSSATKSGINELLKKGSLDKIIQENEIVKETKLVENLFIHLKKDDGLAVYGFEEVSKADEFGSVDIIMISEKKIHEERIERLIKSVESKNGKIEIISTTHDSGEQFNRMGGVAATLRFKLY